MIIRFLQKYWDWIVLAILILGYIVLLTTFSILRHNAFASGYDLANADQTIWNTLNGRFFALSGNETTISRFSVHSDLILIILSPLYLIWNDVRMLLLSQSFFIGVGAVAVYLLALRILKSKIISLAIVFVYLLNPGMQWTNIYDFHAVSLAIPFLLFAFYFAYTERWIWFAVFSVLAFLTKEEIALVVAMMGLAIFFVFRKKLIGVLTFAISIFWFLAMFFLIIPRFSAAGEHWALDWYRYFDGETGVIRTVPTFKVLIGRFFVAPEAWGYYASLLKPFAFLPLLGFPWLFLALPELAINVLSTHQEMRNIIFHYDSGIVPALIIATIFGFRYFQLVIKKIGISKRLSKTCLYFVLAFLLIIALIVDYKYGPWPIAGSCWWCNYAVTDDKKKIEQILKTIPPSYSVTASSEVRPHLTHREKAFNLPAATSSADFVALILRNENNSDYPSIDYDAKLVENLLTGRNYKLVTNIDRFYLFKKNSL